MFIVKIEGDEKLIKWNRLGLGMARTSICKILTFHYGENGLMKKAFVGGNSSRKQKSAFWSLSCALVTR
jgi:hypothetical protein